MVEMNPPDAVLSRILPQQTPQQNADYVPSQFVLTFSHNGKQYAFHTLTQQLLETELPVSEHGHIEKEALVRGLFLVPKDKDECAYYLSVSALMRTISQKKGNRGFMILPTFGCNARCVYCYEEGMKPISMTEQTADATVRYIAETHAADPVKINWFGGEPLLRTDIIDRVCEGLKQAGVCYRCGMVSNGSLITEEIIGKMKGLWNVTGIQISMDGAERDYIARKRYVVYRDAYHRVIHAISRMSEEGIGVIIRCNTDESIWDGIPQFLTDMAAEITHKEHVRLYFSPLDQVRTGSNALPMWKKILASESMIEKAGFKPFLQYGTKLKFNVHHCMADAGSVVIGPDGSLYPCEHCMAETRFGDVFHGTTDEAARRTFCRTDRVREQCRHCTFLPICTGFSTCPVQDTDCRKVRELFTVRMLKNFIDNKTIKADGEDPIC
jgi:radical SAM protein with 4Fe4S-binding SPASM domain